MSTIKIGLYDSDGHNFPSIPLMKISAYHKAKGDTVEFAKPLFRYDKVYVSRVFGNEYSSPILPMFDADEVIIGGTGNAIKVIDGNEVYEKSLDADLPSAIEHIYPDYTLYPEHTKNTAFGFLTRGCPNNCPFCIISKKEGRKSVKVADLSEFWKGQTHIKLLDPNILACAESIDLLGQLAESGAKVDFTQGLDARFVTEEKALILKNVTIEKVHFAFDLMKNESAVLHGLDTFKKHCNIDERNAICYMLVGFNTTIEEDLHRIKVILDHGYTPDVRIYRKPTAPKILKDLQRWCNNRYIYRSCNFMDYAPRKDGKTIKELYF